jgi:hypothetical protein
MEAIDAQIALDEAEAASAGAHMVVAIWDGHAGEAARIMAEMEGGPFPVTSTVVSLLWRSGQHDAARAHARAHSIDLTQDDVFSLVNWAMAADVSLHLGDADLAADAYVRLAPLAGRSVCMGSGHHMGPVDLYLAEAAAARGLRDLASRHADQGLRLCEQWQIPLAGRWFREQREQYGF